MQCTVEQLRELERPLTEKFEEEHLWAEIYVSNTEDGPCIEYDLEGDWKHDHLRSKYILADFFRERGLNYNIDIDEKPSDSDWYEATYFVYVYDTNQEETVQTCKDVPGYSADLVTM